MKTASCGHTVDSAHTYPVCAECQRKSDGSHRDLRYCQSCHNMRPMFLGARSCDECITAAVARANASTSITDEEPTEWTAWTVCPRCSTQIAIDDYQEAAGMCDDCILETTPDPDDFQPRSYASECPSCHREDAYMFSDDFPLCHDCGEFERAHERAADTTPEPPEPPDDDAPPIGLKPGNRCPQCKRAILLPAHDALNQHAWCPDLDCGYVTASGKYQEPDEEGTWWWELNLPRTASETDVRERYQRLLASRTNPDDIDRLPHAFSRALDAIADRVTYQRLDDGYRKQQYFARVVSLFALALGLFAGTGSASATDYTPTAPIGCTITHYWAQDDMSAIAVCAGGYLVTKQDGPVDDWNDIPMAIDTLVLTDANGGTHDWPVWD